MTLELLLIILLLLWLYFRWRHHYWASQRVPHPPSKPVIGHFDKLFFVNKQAWEFYDEIYYKFQSSSMCGIYELTKPVLVVWDPDIIKQVFVKDFDYFTDRRQFDLDTGHNRDKISMEMLSLKQGAEWRSLRAIMTPTFTSGKIKSMFPLVCDKADALVNFSMRQASENEQVDMKKNFGRYTMDTIASCAFGIECNSLVDESAEFPQKAEIFFNSSLRQLLKIGFLVLSPRAFKLLNKVFPLTINPPEMDFFMNVVKQTVKARQKGKNRGDFLDLLLEARENSNPDDKKVLSDLCLMAQSVLFIVAGYDTTASMLAFSAFLLAKHKDQQQRLRDEVRQMVEEHGGFTYQGIVEAKLLDACLQESLRLYPPGIVLERCCSKRYKLYGSSLKFKPGDLIQVPVWSLHHDPRHWPDPEKFIPDRFLPKNKGKIHPFTHMPFGVGPRNCIAMRFGLLEAKVALAKLLLEAELKPAPGHEELSAETSRGVLRPKSGVILNLKPIR